MQEALIGAVRITHIGSAIMLAGGGFLYTSVIAPTLAKRLAGPKIGEVMYHLRPQHFGQGILTGALIEGAR